MPYERQTKSFKRAMRRVEDADIAVSTLCIIGCLIALLTVI